MSLRYDVSSVVMPLQHARVLPVRIGQKPVHRTPRREWLNGHTLLTQAEKGQEQVAVRPTIMVEVKKVRGCRSFRAMGMRYCECLLLGNSEMRWRAVRVDGAAELWGAEDRWTRIAKASCERYKNGGRCDSDSKHYE